MPRNFSELTSGGGTIPMLSPDAEKWGDASTPSPTVWRPWRDNNPEAILCVSTSCQNISYLHKQTDGETTK